MQLSKKMNNKYSILVTKRFEITFIYFVRNDQAEEINDHVDRCCERQFIKLNLDENIVDKIASSAISYMIITKLKLSEKLGYDGEYGKYENCKIKKIKYDNNYVAATNKYNRKKLLIKKTEKNADFLKNGICFDFIDIPMDCLEKINEILALITIVNEKPIVLLDDASEEEIKKLYL